MTSIIYYPGYSQVIIRENLLVRTILDITNDFPMVVTTDGNHEYVAGMKVRFLIPSQFGMVELNNLDGQVIDLTDDTLTIDIDSKLFTPFVAFSPVGAFTPASIIPNSSGKYLSPLPLPYGNQDSFQGTIYNAGQI